MYLIVLPPNQAFTPPETLYEWKRVAKAALFFFPNLLLPKNSAHLPVSPCHRRSDVRVQS
jgi:hypothetical protein